MNHSTLTTDQILREIDDALKAYGESIDRGLALAAEMYAFADSVESGLKDAKAELEEWV
jgi:hypothetical protein